MATARVLPSGSWRVRMFVGIENGKKGLVLICGSLHKSVNIIIRQNLQKKQFWLKKLEFL